MSEKLKGFIPGAIIGGLLLAVVPALAATTQVTPASMNGWYFYDDASNTQLSDTTEHGIVTGPGTPVVGTGSVHLTKTATDRYGIATTQFEGTPLSSITALSYSTYRASGTSAQAPSLGFDIDTDNTVADTVYEGRLTYEPYFTQTVNTGSWQTWDTMSGANWWFSHANNGNPNQVVTSCTQSTPCTWAQVLAAFPNAAMRNPGQFILRTNGADGEAFDGNVDNLTVGVSGTSTTFDFDPNPLPTTVYVNSDGVCASQTPCYTTIQAGVNAVASGGTVNVAAGTYSETVSVGKALTLNGAEHGVAAFSGSGTARTASESSVKEIDVTASNVTVDGFTFTNSAGSQINVTGASVLSGVAIKNNIFNGYSNVGLVTLEAGNIAISGNLFTNPVPNSEAIQVKDFSSGNHGCTNTSITSNAFVAATDNGGADVNLSCTSSNSTSVTVSNNYDADNQRGSSFTAFSGVDSGITVSGNTVLRTSGSSIYFFGAITGSVSVTGNSITGATTSSAVSVQGINGANTGTFTITGNTLSGNGRGLKIGGDAGSDISGSAAITFNNNNISASTIEAVKNNSTSGITIDATKNFWSSTANPVVGTDIAGAGQSNVTYSPWYSDAAMTNLVYEFATSSTGTSTTATTGGSSTTLEGTSTSSGNVDVTAEIPAGTTITGTASWDGTIEAPMATTTSVTVSGATTNVTAAVAIGSNDSDLTFDKAVKLTFAGQSGKRVGWYNHAGTFTEIDTTCTGNNDEPTQTTNLTAGGSCKFDTATDMVVWTKHFSVFVAYTQTTNTTSGGGGGGGNGAPAGTIGTQNAVIPTTSTANTTTNTTPTSNTNTTTTTNPPTTQPTTPVASSSGGAVAGAQSTGHAVAVGTAASTGPTAAASPVIASSTGEATTTAATSSELGAAVATTNTTVPTWVWVTLAVVVLLGVGGLLFYNRKA